MALAAHGSLFVWLSRPIDREALDVAAASPVAEIVPVSFEPAPPPLAAARPISVVVTPRRASPRRRPPPRTEAAPSPRREAGPTGVLDLFDAEGRPRLPEDALAEASKPGFRTPGRGGEDDVFYRPKALDYEATRFEQAWQPPQSLGSEWLERAMAASSGQLSIPLNPKFRLVCAGSLLAAVGSCTIVGMDPGVRVERSSEPPPWQRARRVQCGELEARLAAAQDAAEVAFVLDRLAALCVATPANDEPGAGPGS